MAKCSFCSKQVELGKGVIFVAFDRTYNFCSSKCIKNFKLGRESSKLSWVKKTAKARTKDELKAELLEEAKEEEEKKEERKHDKVETPEEAPSEKKEEKAEKETKAVEKPHK